MGGDEDPGLIPRGCAAIFERGQAMVDAGEATSFSVEVSYLEIYLEMIKDLLNPEGSGAGAGPGGALVVREHARFGVFVPGLERLVASSYGSPLSSVIPSSLISSLPRYTLLLPSKLAVMMSGTSSLLTSATATSVVIVRGGTDSISMGVTVLNMPGVEGGLR